MVVRLLTSLSGPAVSLAAGDLLECDQAQALRLIAAGFAEDPAGITAAVQVAPEAAVIARAKGRKPGPKA